MDKRFLLRGVGWTLLLILAVLFIGFAIVYGLYASILILNGG